MDGPYHHHRARGRTTTRGPTTRGPPKYAPVVGEKNVWYRALNGGPDQTPPRPVRRHCTSWACAASRSLAFRSAVRIGLAGGPSAVVCTTGRTSAVDWTTAAWASSAPVPMSAASVKSHRALIINIVIPSLAAHIGSEA